MEQCKPGIESTSLSRVHEEGIAIDLLPQQHNLTSGQGWIAA